MKRATPPASASLLIRSLSLRDLDRILEIDAKVTGKKAKAGDNDLWRLIAETTTCFGAESEGRLVGFVLADVRPWEFGNRAPVGWVIMVGVDPTFQGHGVGRRLGERVLESFRGIGVGEVKTLVADGDGDLREYFASLGFKPSRELVLRAKA